VDEMATIKRQQIAGMNIHYLYYPLDYFLDSLVAAGIETIELWGGAPHFWMDHMSYDDCKIIQKKVQKRGLTIGVFTPESAIYQYQIASQEPEQLKKSIQYFSNGIRVAAELGAKYMAVNSGWGYWNESLAEAWKRSADSLSKLAQVGQQEGVILAMESMRPEETHIVSTLNDCQRMFLEIDSPFLKVMIDTVAMGVAGETIQQWFDAFGDNIVHTHFVDGRPYGHLIWGDGCYPLEKFLQVLNDNHYSGLLGQEITDSRYYANPAVADIALMQNLARFISD
jgi:protein FrlC